VRLGTFKAAAHRLNLTVSAVSHRIKSLGMLWVLSFSFADIGQSIRPWTGDPLRPQPAVPLQS
jgi:hypothetical protein